MCGGCICVSTHTCTLAVGEQTRFVCMVDSHPSACCLIAALKTGFTWPPLWPLHLSHLTVKSWLTLLHFILNADFKRKQEGCILKYIIAFEASTTKNPNDPLSGKHLTLDRSTFNVFPIHFCSVWRAAFIVHNCQGRQCACQVDMTWTTITFDHGRLLFHNLTLDVSQGVSSRGRDFSNHETYFPCSGIECIWRSGP